MIVDNLTKFTQKRKLLMTPKHPLYAKDTEFRIMYGAAVFMQAEVNCLESPLNNYELERLLLSGFHLEPDGMAKVLRCSKEKSVVLEFLLEHMETGRERYLLLLDVMNVSIRNHHITQKEEESILLFAKMFGITNQERLLLLEFAYSASNEQVNECRKVLHRMHSIGMELSPVDMKYYIMQLWETVECTQEMLEQEQEVRIVDRCHIKEDLVLKEGMSLIFDHAQVRIDGNILLLGGKLIIEDSKVIRKGDRHRACVNMKEGKSRIYVADSEIDCRNLGMFLRAEAGILEMDHTYVYHTTRGAAIRFWGHSVRITNSTFSDCYSHEDGGALMIRAVNALVRECRFIRCEAKRGGAIFAVEGNEIKECTFEHCSVSKYGAAIFYHGFVRAKVNHLHYKNCFPEGVETVQYLAKMGTFQITGEYRIVVSTIVDCPVMVEAQGNLVIENARLYLNYPIHCRGSLQMKNVVLISNHLTEGDMIVLEHSRQCRIHSCEFNGMGKTGGLNASGCRITITKSLFRNTKNGRAVFNPYASEIRECIFNFCQDGGVYCQNGDIKRCLFVNCRSKTGAGVWMYGTQGTVEQCRFQRCIAEYSGGAVDRSLGQRVIHCAFERCKPNDIS